MIDQDRRRSDAHRFPRRGMRTEYETLRVVEGCRGSEGVGLQAFRTDTLTGREVRESSRSPPLPEAQNVFESGLRSAGNVA